MTVQLKTVAADEGDTRLDRWLKRHVPALTQGAVQKMLRTGQIRVDGKRAEANTRLLPGQEIRIPPVVENPNAALPRTPKPVDERDAKALAALVIHKDSDVLVLDKPHGMPVQGGPNITRHLDGMLDALRFEAEDRPRLVHRLDRDTSGVLVLARTVGAASKLAAAFRGRDVEKTYWAVVLGEPTPPAGRIDMALVRQGGPRGERTAPAEPGDDGAFAITDFRTLDVVRRKVAWLEMKPQTGRTHQLRVHAAEALGCPILGDGKYGGQAAHLEGLSGSLHLHARALRLPHPAGGWLEVAAPLPPHMKETFAFFGFEAPRPPKARRVS
ncbi:RluA family pseudouridine synthase [Falsiroseomonas selenitidurans]|uniref:Pseudouridine synthase n=1 Tax=Falsiroseomonas selenitidurans TaxID=2716335 RepID=A0ABX1E9U6_9PROT|nr:RluA family pseudouridine synthase [Falsiroseomonas selenitidurans]NKC34010.1 RluA family pseudouridine synthase [Falsiroseomonas selenitidurans]